MTGGYMGKLLFVDLSTGEIRIEAPDDNFYRNFVGGYGLGARVLYSRQKAGVDVLGPENILGLITGPLTGTPAPFGCRYTAVAKSPLTGGWGDANSGGDFGPHLKFAGFDGVFFKGIAEKPTYLFINNGRAELKDAGHLWGKSTEETHDIIQAEVGKQAKIACIGPAGEKLSFISSILNHRGGSAAGRSGLGAVMGAKKLKAVAVAGENKVPVADLDLVNRLRSEHIVALKAGPFLETFHKYGTAGHADSSAHSGDTPVKNWGGVGVIDLPDVSGLHKDKVGANVDSRTGCWHCPVACKAELRAGTGDYHYPQGSRRPEYETLAAFGAMCLNSDPETIAMANYLCNSNGLDTISTGTVVAFAMECYSNGVITKADTEGLELNWGNRRAMVQIIELLARREGFGDVLADGVKIAAQRIGRGAEEFAVHIGGQELGLHDPKFDFPPFIGTPTSAKYMMDAAPGRHTAGFGPTQFFGYLLNSAGYCMHGNIGVVRPERKLEGYLNAVTGWGQTWEEMLKSGERIGTLRHLFTLRENDNPLKRQVHGRIIGRPPQKAGPLAGVTTNLEAQIYWNLGAMDWDPVTTRPSKRKLLELGLNDIASELYG